MGGRAALGLILTVLVASGARAATVSRRLVPEMAFPSSREFFDPLMADNAELGYGGRYVMPLGGDTYGEVTLGDYVGLLRWEWVPGLLAQLNLGGGVNARFNLTTPRNQLEVADFTVAVPLDLRWGEAHTVRTGYWHASSHLGDDYIARTAVRLDKKAIDATRAVYAWTPREWVRLYGGLGVAFNTVNIPGRASFQFGGELFGPRLRNRNLRPFLAQDFQTWERVAWKPAYALRAGLRVSDEKHIAAARAFLEYYTGRLYYFQFNDVHESRWTIGLNFEIGNPAR